MAHFYAEIQGNRGLASRMGDVSSGIWGHIRGWNIGGEVLMDEHDGVDRVEFYLTGGSNGGPSEKLFIMTVELTPGGPRVTAIGKNFAHLLTTMEPGHLPKR